MIFVSNSINDDSRLHLNQPQKISVFNEKSSEFCTLYRMSKKSLK